MQRWREGDSWNLDSSMTGKSVDNSQSKNHESSYSPSRSFYRWWWPTIIPVLQHIVCLVINPCNETLSRYQFNIFHKPLQFLPFLISILFLFFTPHPTQLISMMRLYSSVTADMSPYSKPIPYNSECPVQARWEKRWPCGEQEEDSYQTWSCPVLRWYESTFIFMSA